VCQDSAGWVLHCCARRPTPLPCSVWRSQAFGIPSGPNSNHNRADRLLKRRQTVSGDAPAFVGRDTYDHVRVWAALLAVSITELYCAHPRCYLGLGTNKPCAHALISMALPEDKHDLPCPCQLYVDKRISFPLSVIDGWKRRPQAAMLASRCC
jgi:hypothetical protein